MAVYLIAGASGMLGTALQQVIVQRGQRCLAPLEENFDITDEDSVRAQVSLFAAGLEAGDRGVLINAAAYTDVERAESEPELAHLVNEVGPGLLAAAARDAGLHFVHVSTDFVFDGEKDGAYTEEDAVNPLSVYGASKLAGEQLVAERMPDSLIVRTAWVFAPRGANFPRKIAQAAASHPSLRVVTDEVGSPTYTLDLAAGIIGLVDAGATGVFHLAGSGDCSRYELAIEVLRVLGLAEVAVEPVTADAFPTKARRPRNSVLNCSRAAAAGVRMPDWRDAVARWALTQED